MDDAMSGGTWLLLAALMTVVSGLVIGALARWIMPGPDPMSIGKTILLGMAGSLLGGLAASLFRLSPAAHPLWILVLEIGGRSSCSGYLTATATGTIECGDLKKPVGV